MAKSKSYQDSLIESLKDPTEAAEYLTAALEDGEREVFLLALRDVVDSFGGMGKLAASTSLNRENLYRMLSTKGNPEFFSLLTVLGAVGFRLAVEPKSAGISSKPKTATSKIVLHSSVAHVKEPSIPYALAAETESRTKSAILRTGDNKEVGTLSFDYGEGTLILQVTGQISANRVQEAEIQTADGATLPARISVEGENRLVLLRKAKVFHKDISKVILTMAE